MTERREVYEALDLALRIGEVRRPSRSLERCTDAVRVHGLGAHDKGDSNYR